MKCKDFVQKYPGFNFISLLNDIKEEEYPGAQIFEQLVVQKSPDNKDKLSLEEIIKAYRNRLDIDGNSNKLDQFVLNILEEHGDPSLIGFMLAERSLYLEEYQKENYGKYLTQSKEKAARTLADFQISQECKLSDKTIERTLRQIDTASFASLDHLMEELLMQNKKE